MLFFIEHFIQKLPRNQESHPGHSDGGAECFRCHSDASRAR